MKTITEIIGHMARGQEIAICDIQLQEVRSTWISIGRGGMTHYYCRATGATMVYADEWQILAREYAKKTSNEQCVEWTHGAPCSGCSDCQGFDKKE